MNRVELQELIDACRRPADLNLSELRPLAEHVQTDPAAQRLLEESYLVDGAIRVAVNDVPVPAGLEDRLLQAVLGPSSTAATVDELDDDTTKRIATQDTNIDPPPTLARRGWGAKWKWLSLASVGAAAAIALLCFVLWPQHEPNLATASNVIEAGEIWLGQISDANWKSSDLPVRSHPLPSQLRSDPVRWQFVSAMRGGPKVACYDLVNKGKKAWLFVAPTSQKTDLSTMPPAKSYQHVGTWDVAMWKGEWNGKSVVYLLSFQGGIQQYQSLIGGGQPVAQRSHSRRAVGVSPPSST